MVSSLRIKPLLYVCLLLWICLLSGLPGSRGFSVLVNHSRNEVAATRRNAPSLRLSLVQMDGYNEALATIDACSVSGKPSDDLYKAVRFVDKNAFQLYPTWEDKQALWQRAHGSWKLQLATGGGKSTTFQPVPIFAFAMVDERNFGNGVGWNQDNIILSLLGPHIFNEKRRQMVITIDDMYLWGGTKVTKFVPGFLKEGMGLGKRPEEFKRAPAFTFIGASDKSLMARGGSGGIAIWTRLDKDIRPAAYKSNPENTDSR